MSEIWRPVVGYEEYYEVSNMGRVRSFDRVTGSGYGSTRVVKGRILKELNHGNGYMCVNLFKDKKQKQFLIHRLVAQAFVPNPNNLPEVDHINTVRNDNRSENLRWVTISQNHRNIITRWRMSEAIKNSPNTCRKKKVKMLKDGELIRVFNTITEAAKFVGCNTGNICHALKGDFAQAYGYQWQYA